MPVVINQFDVVPHPPPAPAKRQDSVKNPASSAETKKEVHKVLRKNTHRNHRFTTY